MYIIRNENITLLSHSLMKNNLRQKIPKHSFPPMASKVFFGLLRRHLLRHHSQHIPSHHYTTSLPLPKPLLPTETFFNSYRSRIFHHPQHPLLRLISTRSTRPTRSKKTDIGARARQLQTRLLWTYAITFSCIAGFIVVVLNQFQDQLVFYVTPTEALEKYNADPSKSKFHLGGLVLESSIAQTPSSHEIQFVVTDLIMDILVKYEGSLPDLFRKGHSAVVEGFIKPIDEKIREEEEAILRNMDTHPDPSVCVR
ncbi:hypothetical protein ACS0TY_004140 [Phlomoides rotata]